jgi:L-ribulose-5-phosphate 4-epimerase
VASPTTTLKRTEGDEVVPAEPPRSLERRLVEAGRRLEDGGLARARSGNISARRGDRMRITAAGARLGALTSDDLVWVSIAPAAAGGVAGRRPSSETTLHAAIYTARPDVGAIVHTHSPYATAWAARGEPIPCSLTAMADEFGGDIPVGPFALIGDDTIGRGIVETLRASNSPAVLMRQHGPFTIGRTAKAAVKAAVMTEDVARTMHLARQLGFVDRLPDHAVEALHDRYQNVYGQR